MAVIDRHNPVVGATVTATAERPAPAFHVTSTDEKGYFRLDGLAEGAYRVEFSRDGFEPIVKEHVVLRFPFRSVVEVVLRRGVAPPVPAAATRAGTPPSARVTLSGKIVAREGASLAEVQLRLHRRDGTEDPRAAFSRPDGTFEFGELSDGLWQLDILGAGFLPIRIPANLEKDTRIDVVLVRQPANYAPSPIDLLPPEEPIPPPAPQASG